MQADDSAPIAKPFPRQFAFAIGTILLPIGIFYGFLARHMVNIPILDDYDYSLTFLGNYSRMHSVFAKVVAILVAQHNEYKAAFPSAVVVLQYELTGHPNFIVLSWIGDLFILMLFFLMWRYFLPQEENVGRRLIYFAPAAYLLFQFQYAEALNWSLPDLQYFSVLAFAFATVAALSHVHSRSFLIACVMMALSIAASGNGFALLPIGIVMLLHRKAWAQTGIWILVAGLSAAIYFYHYNFHSSQQDSHVSVLHAFHYLDPVFTLAFMGSALSLHMPFIHTLAIPAGAFMVVIAFLMWRKRYYVRNPAFFYFNIFLILTAIGVSGIRSKLGMDISLSGRYKTYSDLLLICCYVFILEYLKKPQVRQRFVRVALACSMLFWALYMYKGAGVIVARDRDATEGVRLFKSSEHQLGPVILNGDAHDPKALELDRVFRPVIEESETTGLYRFP